VKRALVLALLAVAVAAPAARADGDPASDFLLTEQVFYPYYSNVPKASLTQLKQTVADANKRGYTLRVAVITSPYDLGSLSALWPKPKAYANFLALELSFVYRGRLLVVTPNGFGYNAGTKTVNKTPVDVHDPKTLAFLRTVPIGKGTNGLLQTADRAVRLLAARQGVELPAATASASSGSSSSSDTIIIAVAAVVGAVLVAGLEVLRRRRRNRRVSNEPEGANPA
jgi:MYXO-CTERM domain-containing protein